MLFNNKNKNENPNAPPAPMPAQAVSVFDATDATFEQEVLLASMERPVAVDFWSPRSQASKQLSPMLEKLIAAAAGAVALARVDVDKNPGIAAALRIQSVPTVYAFFQGRPVDGFQGAVPEAQVKAFVDMLTQISKQAAPDAIDIPETLKAAALALAEKNIAAAQSLYAQILMQDKNNAAAYVGMVRCLLAAGDIPQAKNLVSNAPPEISKAPVFAEARAALELAEKKPQGSAQGLIDKLAADPNDHQSRYDLALAEFGNDDREQAVEHLLEIVRRKKDWNENAARKQLLKFFEAMGAADPLTIQGRKKLSSILFS